jgi:aldehyde dehydrogenase (NAD+)
MHAVTTIADTLHFPMLIGGKWTDGAGTDRISSSNPFDGRDWATVPNAGAADVDQAVRAARRAFDTGDWPRATPAARARLLRTLGGLIESNADELGEIQVRENGKLIREVSGQTRALAGHCYYYAGLAETIHGYTAPTSVPNMVNYTLREPIGVIAAITPWNSPLALLMWKLAPALAAGNTVVVKPSEVTPVSTLKLAALITESGFPAGVVNVVTGAADTGGHLVEHPGVDKIAFTGSTAVGKRIARTAADRLARVSLELGGKSPNIVFPDADLDNAVNGVISGIFAATGQTCMAGSRALVHIDVYDDFAAQLVARTEKIRLGDPMDPASEMGTVACQSQYDKVLRYIDIAKGEGATLLVGGGRPNDPALTDGLFVRPTIFGDVRNDMRIAQEEVFGPVLTLIRFADEEEAVRIANDTPYGLAAGIWCSDVRLAHRMIGKLRAGTVWVNNYRKTSYSTPFGGYGQSGLGRENGIDAINDYTETKSVWIDTGNAITDPFNPRG